jgi:hypothetical protein
LVVSTNHRPDHLCHRYMALWLIPFLFCRPLSTFIHVGDQASLFVLQFQTIANYVHWALNAVRLKAWFRMCPRVQINFNWDTI